MKSKALGIAASAVGAALVSGCYVVPIDPRYTAAAHASHPLPQAGGATIQARLYPLNDLAGRMGTLAVSLSDNINGHATFSVMHADELLRGEATRVGPHYPGFGKVHREVYGEGRMPVGERGIASAAGTAGLYVNCEYVMTTSKRGAGACLFSNGAKYQLHFGA